MMTFLTDLDFKVSIDHLDQKRAWKQVVEAKQMLCALEAGGLPESWQKSESWGLPRIKNHPATQAWKFNIVALKAYYNEALWLVRVKHKVKTKLMRLKDSEGNYYSQDNLTNSQYPWWYGEPKYHRSHRARLIDKDFAYFNWKFPLDAGFNDGQHYYPKMDGSMKFFRMH